MGCFYDTVSLQCVVAGPFEGNKLPQELEWWLSSGQVLIVRDMAA
jgi:hypothetical protein